ncbi:MAG: PQQ-binding-like beta-propeller repeat protein [Candidatus Coatesbacteria bacterium]|nr:MAG: PQQ-binding-like beta-propeller repeat protein [Candidatus Coatesbacteria bacterium]
MQPLIVTAALVWAFRAGAPADAPPLLTPGYVYYAAADKKLYALRAEDGEEFWSRRFKAPLAVAPVAEGNSIFQYVPYPEGKLYALRAGSGEIIWRAAAGPGVVTPAVGEGVVAAGRREEAAFWEAATGRELGAVPFEETVVGLAYAGDGVFVAWTGGGYVAACRPGEAAAVWTARPVVGGVFVTTAGDRLYVVAAAGTVAAYGLAAGEEIWRAELGEPVAGAGVWVGGELVVPGRRTVAAFEATAGGERWRWAPGGNVRGLAAAPGGVAIVACEDGRVYAGGGSTGWKEIAQLEEFAASGPAVSGDFLFVTDGKNRVRCYRLAPESP